MLVDVGYYLLFAIVLLSFWAVCAFLAGGLLREVAWVRSGRRSLYLVFGASLVCSLIVIWSMIAQDYSVAYVAQVSDRSLPLHLRKYVSYPTVAMPRFLRERRFCAEQPPSDLL